MTIRLDAVSTCGHCGVSHLAKECPRCGGHAQPATAVREPSRPTRMNKTEARYAQYLAALQAVGEVNRYYFEPVRFRLADRTTYTPDFMVVVLDRVEFHEVKGGFVRDDARVKFKVAREMFPAFGWMMAQWKDGKWTKIL